MDKDDWITGAPVLYIKPRAVAGFDHGHRAISCALKAKQETVDIAGRSTLARQRDLGASTDCYKTVHHPFAARLFEFDL